MQERIYQVDAFTSEPFKGNPAGVALLTQERPAAWMQRMANEMNLSETAFLVKAGSGYTLRWFTPTVEVDLCGHATLASAYVLFSEGLTGVCESIDFITASGILRARNLDDWVELDFPAFPLKALQTTDEMIAALGFSPKEVFETDVNLLVEMDSLSDIRKFHPDYARLRKLPFQGLIITAAGENEEFDFASRYFAPQAGIDEDPVTGSAHCSLAPYWSPKLEKTEMTACQASSRGGTLRLKLQEERVLIQGQAVIVFKGNLCV